MMLLSVHPTVRDGLFQCAENDQTGLCVGVATKDAPKILHLAPTLPDDTGSMRPSLLSHHYRQVERMLPGGLSILGIYTISPTTTTPPGLLPHLLKLFHQEQIIHINFNPKTKDIHCNVVNNQETIVKIQIAPFPLLKIASEFDTSGVVVQQEQDKKVGEGIDSVVELWEKTRLKIFINGHTPSSAEYVDQSTTSILLEQIPAELITKQNEFLNHLHLQGVVFLTAFILEGSSEIDACQALTQDLHRTLKSRLLMHKESLVDEETLPQITSKIYHEIPRRVFVPLLENVLISDYLFPGEGPGDCIKSFRDIFGLTVDENDIDEGKEKDEKSPSMEQLLEITSEITSKMPQKNMPLIILTIITTIVSIFIAIYYNY